MTPACGRSQAGDVADLGQQHQRGERAHAGQLGEYPYPRVGLRVLAHLLIQPADGPATASVSARQSSMISRETAGSSREASHWRPGPLQQPAGRP